MFLEKAFGIVPVRRTKNGFQVFLVKKREGHVGFPKGHPEKNEDAKKTAERELLEETNLTPVKYLSEDPFVESYTLKREGENVLKTVAYYLAEVEGEVVLEEGEIASGGWVDLQEAKNKITFAQSKSVAEKAEKFLNAK